MDDNRGSKLSKVMNSSSISLKAEKSIRSEGGRPAEFSPGEIEGLVELVLGAIVPKDSVTGVPVPDPIGVPDPDPNPAPDCSPNVAPETAPDPKAALELAPKFDPNAANALLVAEAGLSTGGDMALVGLLLCCVTLEVLEPRATWIVL